MANSDGLQWRKLDLHVHTPDSHDFRNPDAVTPDDVVKTALAAGLDGIAVTDHHSAGWIDRVKAAAVGTGLVVFPGVEIPTNAGKNGIHVIALFDVDKDASHVEDLLSNVGITPEKRGAQDAVAPSLPDTIQKIGKAGGLAVLAHCKSSKGVLGDISGAPRKQVFERPELYAVEVAASDFSSEKQAKGTRAVDLLDGTDANFCHRRLGVYLASDNPFIDPKSGDPAGHCLGGIGSRYTYFKIDSPITLEGLRQCLTDRDVRIQFPESATGAPPDLGHSSPKIASLSVDGGFLAGQTLEFHDSLNTIIGAKGSGKSLTIEFLRFVLDRAPTERHIAEDHAGKLDTQLGLGGRVTVEIIDRSGTKRRITRTYNPRSGSPYEQPIMQEYAKDFPAQFLSQNEIVRIAENRDLQIGFIDSFFDFSTLSASLAQLQRDLVTSDREYAETLTDLSQYARTAQRAEALGEQIAALDKALGDPECVQYFSAKAVHAAVGTQATFIRNLGTSLGERIDELSQSPAPKLQDSVAEQDLPRKARSTAEKARNDLISVLQAARKAVDARVTEADAYVAKANAELSTAREAYEGWAKGSGGDAAKLSQERDRLQSELDRLSIRLGDQQSKLDLLKARIRKRGQLLSRLRRLHTEYSTERQARCATFNTHSGGKIKATVEASSDRQEFNAALTAMKKGSRLEQPDIDAICTSVSPQELVMRILKYHLREDDSTDPLVRISQLSRVPIERIRRLADHLLDKCGYGELLRLQHSVQPTDSPDIEVRVADGTYRRLNQVSTGQKCTAMIVMALCTGDNPICIDQPEDSLDIRTIWEDMCCTVRTAKSDRQFIFTSHSSNLAVSSDTDKYTVLVADASQASVIESGAIESARVKEEVVLHLEGGERAYRTKYEKYNIDLRPQ